MDEHFLASILQDLGPENGDRGMFLDILHQVQNSIVKGSPEKQVAAALRMMVDNATGRMSPTNVTHFCSAVLETVILPRLSTNQ